MTTTEPAPLRVRKLADRSEGERLSRLVARSFVLREDGAAVIDPADCERILVNPATDGYEHEPWPFAGLAIEGAAPKRTRVDKAFIARHRADGSLTVEGERVVHRPGGPPEDPWRVTHTFVHLDAIVLHTVDGDVRYRVTENPDKWPAAKDGDLGFGGEVRWVYDLRLEG